MGLQLPIPHMNKHSILSFLASFPFSAFSGHQDLPKEEGLCDVQLPTIIPSGGHAGAHLPEHL